jgi:hypothetical protein
LGTNPEGRDKNQRVEVFMLSEVVEDLQGTQAERDRRFLPPESEQPATTDAAK